MSIVRFILEFFRFSSSPSGWHGIGNFKFLAKRFPFWQIGFLRYGPLIAVDRACCREACDWRHAFSDVAFCSPRTLMNRH